MSAIVNNTTDLNVADNNIVTLPTLPESGPGCVRAKRLDEFVRSVASDGQELLKDRFLCRKGGMLLVGPTGIGKSSMTMQLMIRWGLGQSCFDIRPAKPLKSLLIQAENDNDDIFEMREGVFDGVNLSEAEKTSVCPNIIIAQVNSKTGAEFFGEVVRPLLEIERPDLLWIDPALAYLGGESNSQEVVGAFLRNQLNPLLAEFDCGGIIVHHTNKPYNGSDRKTATDGAYLGSGSSEWANWARGILTLNPVKEQGIFELKAPKRGVRLGWREADKTTTSYKKVISHFKEPGTICWVELADEVVREIEEHSPRGEEIDRGDLISQKALHSVLV